MVHLWCYIQGGNTMFRVTVSPSRASPDAPDPIIDDLKTAIHKVGSSRAFVGYEPWDLTLIKQVNVKRNEVWEGVNNCQYQSTSNEVLSVHDQKISEIWPQPASDELHVVVTLPHGIRTHCNDPLYIAAKHLHQVMWLNSLEGKLVNVNGCGKLKYLPPTEVRNLQLKALGCNTNSILVREEYLFVTEKLKQYWPNIGGIILTGQPGSGKSVFLFYLLLHLLSIGQPIALQQGKFFYVFFGGGVEMHPSNTTNWKYSFQEKIWALSDSKAESKTPCFSFQFLSQQDFAYIIQATSPAEERWKEWRKECSGRIFTMKYFTENEAKALCIISDLDVESFLANFRKWGPNVRTCTKLVLGTVSQTELQTKATIAAKKFAKDPDAIYMQASSQDVSHVLFTVTPNDDERLYFTLKVTSPYLCGLVVQEIVRLDAAT